MLFSDGTLSERRETKCENTWGFWKEIKIPKRLCAAPVGSEILKTKTWKRSFNKAR